MRIASPKPPYRREAVRELRPEREATNILDAFVKLLVGAAPRVGVEPTSYVFIGMAKSL